MSALFLGGCWNDGGVVDPYKPPKPALARFQGQTNQPTPDSIFSTARWGDLRNPSIALVWQFISPGEYLATRGDASVKTATPFPFDFTLTDPPSDQVVESPDIAIGGFWLFSDRDNNQVFDRLIHPVMEAANHTIDSLYSLYQVALNDFVAFADVRKERVDVVETYHIGRFGVITMGANDEDTVFAGHPQAKKALVDGALNARYRILNYQNRWERFFALRKRDNDYYNVIRPSSKYVYEEDMPFKRKVFPRPGTEREFERKLRNVILAFMQFTFASQDLINEAKAKGYNDHPYNGFFEPGADWVAGRSRAHFVLYFKTQAAVDELKEAEIGSSFVVKGLERLKTGYNLIFCDDQYRCEILPPGSQVAIDLGMTDAFFNPPSRPAEKPVAPEKLVPTPVKATGIDRLAGGYSLQPYYPVYVVSSHGSLWAQIPDEGLLRFEASDSLTFFSPVRDVQLKFVQDDSAHVYKVLIYKDTKRFVAPLDPTLAKNDLADQIAARLAGAAPVDTAQAGLFAGKYEYARDTLRVEWPGGDSIAAKGISGTYPMALVPSGPAAWFNRSAEIRFEFALDTAGKCRGVYVEKGGARVFAPRTGYAFPKAQDLFPGLPDSLSDTASVHAGTTRDRFRGFDGGARYTASADSLFLKTGDGWLDSLGRKEPLDAITLGKGGDFLRFRVPGKADKAMFLVLTLCPERSVKSRVRLSLRGGKDRDRQEDVLGGDLWVDFAGKPVTVKLGPFRAGADPYYARVEQLGTADATVWYALDGYSLIAE